MTYSVYILYSEKLNTFYRGITTNIDERIKRHNNGYEKSTKLGRPWKVVWITIKSNKSEAYTLERKLKNLGTKRILEFMLKYHEDIIPEEFDFIKGFEP